MTSRWLYRVLVLAGRGASSPEVLGDEIDDVGDGERGRTARDDRDRFLCLCFFCLCVQVRIINTGKGAVTVQLCYQSRAILK